MLTACGGGSSGGSTDTGSSSGGKSDSGKSFKTKFHQAEFHEDKAEGGEDAQVDLSCTDKGYIGVHGRSDERLKVQILKGDETYTYDLESEQPYIYPLQCGDGEYTVKIMENVEGNKYYELFSTDFSVSLDSPMAPFVRPNTYANYSKSSACVKEAANLAAESSTECEFVDNVYNYICKNITYDHEEAATISAGYIPDPDEILSTGKGICFDYASLAASMLRSQGIPTKIIFGYVGPEDLYHAWNMFYTEEQGWTTVDFNVNPGDWNRVDLTFSANGQSSEFIGDGTNYRETYEY